MWRRIVLSALGALFFLRAINDHCREITSQIDTWKESAASDPAVIEIVAIIRATRMTVGNKYQNVQQVASLNNVHHLWWKGEG
jgi:hypothetical protein